MKAAEAREAQGSAKEGAQLSAVAPVEEVETLPVFMVFHSDDGETWTLAGEQDAPRREAALQAFYADRDDGASHTHYCALPAAAWKPMRAKVRPSVYFSDK